jgi:uncharacterized damage-inducible protein DinB
MTDSRYPVGRYQFPEHVTSEDRSRWTQEIREAPAKMRDAIARLSPDQLETPYREGGWTVRQVVHHLVDSHMNSYIRFRLALTEDQPTVKSYNEAAWAELPDAKSADVELSLSLLESLHARWVLLLDTLTPEQFQRTFLHPELGPMTLDRNLALYAWHGRHHVAHVQLVRNASASGA